MGRFLSNFSTGRSCRERQSNPINLFVLSACRSALGDSDSEMGLAGMAPVGSQERHWPSLGMWMMWLRQHFSTVLPLFEPWRYE